MRYLRTWQAGRCRLLLLVGLLAVTLSACGGSAVPVVGQISPGDNPDGRVLFAQDGDIYVWDGSIKRVIEVGDASSPRWSGDGTRFAFIRNGDAYSDLYIADADGDNMQQLTHDQPLLQPGTKDYVDNSVWALDPDWSPSGESIVFATDRGTPQNVLWVIDGIGNDATRVEASMANGQQVEHPDFSPDGTRIVFDQRTGNSPDGRRWTEIWVADRNTGQLTPLVQGEKGSYDPAFSPDGRWVAFVQRDGKANDLWVIPSDGGQPTQLTTSGDVAAPAWSPDGKAIAFLQAEGQSFKVSYLEFSVEADGTPKASEPHDFFTAGNIDAPSGLSWAP